MFEVFLKTLFIQVFFKKKKKKKKNRCKLTNMSIHFLLTSRWYTNFFLTQLILKQYSHSILTVTVTIYSLASFETGNIYCIGT